MLIEQITRYFLNPDIFHNLARFLGTPAGELLKRCIELIFFLIIIYMLVSEHKKNQKRDYKYLITGFLSLFIRQAVVSAILFTQVFGTDKLTRFKVLIGYADGYLETLALLLVVSAFVFPAFRFKTKTFQKSILFFLYLITLTTLINYLLFRFEYVGSDFIFIWIDLIKVAILSAPFFLSAYHFKAIKFRPSVLLAFFIYMLIPLSNFFSRIIFGKVDPRLLVLQHPLPFISILLLMRVVYLKLVDKAFLNTQLRESEEKVKHEKELNKLKDHFISVVSHELRTPITSIKLYLSLLLGGKFGKLIQKQQTAIQIVLDENNRLADLISNLLTVNRLDAKKLKPEFQKFNIKEIIDDLYLNIARSKGLKVNLMIPMFYVEADKNLIKQIYINLINNAIKFAKKKIQIKCKKKAGYWYMSIKDDGIGVDEKEIPKLFDRFYQVDNTITRSSQGIGLGLSIVKSLVQLHNGKIDVRSDIGKGTEVKIIIPIKNYLN